MSIMDKLKGAMHSVTGGGAEVSLDHAGAFAPGGSLTVKVSVTAAGELKANGLFVDLRGKGKSVIGQVTGAVGVMSRDHTVAIAEAFTLPAGETRAFEGTVPIPADVDPELDWEIRARVDAFGNDPDSGFHDLR